MSEEMKPCEHNDAWIGSPAGYNPTHWRCSKCGVVFSAGEFGNWMLLRKIASMLEKYLS